MSSKKKRSIFDREYGIRFGLICLIGLSVIALSWTYKFKSDIILTLDENNSKMFDDRFTALADVSQYGEFRMINISEMGQKKMGLMSINREDYGIDMRKFIKLPFVPDDWGVSRYAFENGKYYILRSVGEQYYRQPEFYDDWFSSGIAYNKYGIGGCSSGVFSTPSSQRIYTQSDAVVDTYIIMRSSFCASQAQSMRLKPMYPDQGITDDGITFTQNPSYVESNIEVTCDPDGFILGRTYPVFDADWADKINVRITVNDGMDPGLYIVSLTTDEYRPWLNLRSGVDYDAYKSKAGSSVVNFIIAVD